MGKRRWYFPSKDADVIPWIKNFVAVLAANAARWGIVEALERHYFGDYSVKYGRMPV
jgi:hypothetical protein